MNAETIRFLLYAGVGVLVLLLLALGVQIYFSEL
jgi:hypothetical protein